MITIEMELALEHISEEVATLETELEKTSGEMDQKIKKGKVNMGDVIKLTTIITTVANMKSMLMNLKTLIEMQ